MYGDQFQMIEELRYFSNERFDAGILILKLKIESRADIEVNALFQLVISHVLIYDHSYGTILVYLYTARLTW